MASAFDLWPNTSSGYSPDTNMSLTTYKLKYKKKLYKNTRKTVSDNFKFYKIRIAALITIPGDVLRQHFFKCRPRLEQVDLSERTLCLYEDIPIYRLPYNYIASISWRRLREFTTQEFFSLVLTFRMETGPVLARATGILIPEVVPYPCTPMRTYFPSRSRSRQRNIFDQLAKVSVLLYLVMKL